MRLSFRPIDLDREADSCVAFRRDAFVCSFGTEDGFSEKYGTGGARYLAWLRERIAELPGACVHAWEGDAIVGQLEMRVREGPRAAYINLIYLVPSARGSSAGDQLHEYAVRFFRELSFETIQLSVSPANRRAVAYYRKHGWRDLGPRPGREEVHLMELALGGSFP